MGADIRALEEATAVPFELLVLVERAIYTNTSSRPLLSLFLWQLLIMVWGSLRFDDALHTSPRDITMRRPSSVVVVNKSGACKARYENYRLPYKFVRRRLALAGMGFMAAALPRLPTSSQTSSCLHTPLTVPHYSTPAGYTGFVFNMRAALAHVLLQDSVSEEVRVKLSPSIHKFTAHSLRCTVVSALAK